MILNLMAMLVLTVLGVVFLVNGQITNGLIALLVGQILLQNVHLGEIRDVLKRRQP